MIPLKLSFTTLGCPDWSFEKIVEEAGRMGFDGIEIRGVDGKMRAEEIPLFFPENMERTKAYFAESKLELVGFGTSVSFHDPAGYDAALEEGKAAIDVCSRAGIPFIRVFGDKIEDLNQRQAVIDRVANGIRSLCEYARGKNVDVLLEIHGDFNTLESVLPLIEQLKNSPEFGILWDIEHSDRAYGDSWMEFYGGIKPYIRHTHIKDHRRKGDDFELCLVGDGDIPIADIVRRLEADSYTGWYSLEWEKKWHPELPGPEVALPGFLAYLLGI